MILSIPSRQQAALRSCRVLVQSQCLYNPKSQRRRIHSVPQLSHDEHFRTHGVGGMISPESYDYAWSQYQGYLVDRLNAMTVGTPNHDKLAIDILLATARNPNAASLFNHASMAWNNHRFFTTLSPTPTPPSSALLNKINLSFSSLEGLKAQFLATATSLFGPGYVWLIKDNAARRENKASDPELRILATYIAGSPLPGAHHRRQSIDMNTASNTTNLDGGRAPLRAGTVGPYSGSLDSQMSPGQMTDVEVLLGVNVWQHVWLRDWGFGGKREFLEKWWECVDWDTVEKNALFGMRQSRRQGEDFVPRVGKGKGTLRWGGRREGGGGIRGMGCVGC